MNKDDLQYRYYDTPYGSYVLALLGDRWIRPYGLDLSRDAMHFHNLFEIGICHEGEGTLSLPDKKYQYQAGTISLIPANYLHNTRTEENTASRWEYLFVDVDKFLRATYDLNHNKKIGEELKDRICETYHLTSSEESPLLYDAIILMLDLYRKRPPLYLESSKGLLLHMLITIANLNQKMRDMPSVTYYENNVIQTAIAFIGENYDKPIKVVEIADACHLSESHFRRIFEEAINVPPVQYLNFVRIDAACRMLRTTKEPIQNIASSCGFATLTSFNRNFKAFMGVSPKSWRQGDQSNVASEMQRQASFYEGWD